MTSAKSWLQIKRVAEQQRDVSACGLAQVVARAREAQERLELLLEYRLDYRTRFKSASMTGIRCEWLRNYQQFLGHLEQAIVLQTEVVAELARETAQAKRRVADEQRRAESYQILDDRRSSKSQIRDGRRQQLLQDEMASRSVQRLIANPER